MFWSAVAIISIALIIPPQIKQITYTYQTTKVQFWYPTVLEVRGKFRFTDHVSIQVKTTSNWNYDPLRKENYFCADKKCKAEENPIFVAWSKNEHQLELIAQEIQSFAQAIQHAQNQIISMEDYIAENSCAKVMSGPAKPTFACDQEEAKEVALTTCLIRELGAKACEEGVKQQIDIDAPEFLKEALARESCSSIVHEITGESYNLLDKTVKKYTHNLGPTLLSHLLGSFSNNLKKGFDWLFAAAKAKACIPSGIELCRTKYLNWQASVTEHFARYGQHINYCQGARENLLMAQATLKRSQSYWQSAIAQQDNLKIDKIKLEQEAKTIAFPHLLQILWQHLD